MEIKDMIWNGLMNAEYETRLKELKKGEYFILNVEGDSMIEAGIFDGDQVVIRKANDANNGEIVVALIDNNEATLKRIYSLIF